MFQKWLNFIFLYICDNFEKSEIITKGEREREERRESERDIEMEVETEIESEREKEGEK